MPVRATTFQRLLGTIDAICRSPLCEGYKVGLTTMSAIEKGGRYASPRVDVPYFVLLADRLWLGEAKNLETRLESWVKSLPRQSLLRRKYRPEYPDLPYRANDGGTKKRRASVYMAFWLTE